MRARARVCNRDTYRRAESLVPTRKASGYRNYWFGKGHTGYRSMAHLPAAHGFERSVLFLAGSGSYTTLARFEDDHPVHNATEYSTDLFGRLALDAVEAHDAAAAPLFLYLPWQVLLQSLLRLIFFPVLFHFFCSAAPLFLSTCRGG